MQMRDIQQVAGNLTGGDLLLQLTKYIAKCGNSQGMDTSIFVVKQEYSGTRLML